MSMKELFTLSVIKNIDGTSELDVCLQEKLNREIKDPYMVQVIAKIKNSPPKQNVLDVQTIVTVIVQMLMATSQFPL